MIKVLIWAVIILNFNYCFAQKIHSHNDYLQQNPFWGAFSSGSSSIEVDIFLENGKLLVAHSKNDIHPDNTLEKLYLEPLNQIVNSRKRQTLQMLIDIKSEGESTLNAIIEIINKYPKLAKAYTQKRRPLKFVISGNRPPLSEYTKYPPFILFDHQSILDLEKGDPAKIALVSFSLFKFSLWNGKEPLTKDDEKKLESVIKKVHDLGYPIRFWATPDNPLSWETFHMLGVDFINTDSPEQCKKHFSVIRSL